MPAGTEIPQPFCPAREIGPTATVPVAKSGRSETGLRL
jgi:hypothetical protein